MLVVVMMAVKRKEAWGSGDDGDGDDGDGYDGDHRKALVMIILPMITITVKRSRAVRVRPCDDYTEGNGDVDH